MSTYFAGIIRRRNSTKAIGDWAFQVTIRWTDTDVAPHGQNFKDSRIVLRLSRVYVGGIRAPTEPNIDYYAILEISNIATLEVATKSYRRLAKIRHPDKNPKADSTAVFQLLQNAYDTISDPTKRRAYDLRWPGIKDSLRTQQETNKRQAEAAQAERKSASEARAKKEKEDHARQERLRSLESVKSRYDSDIFELSRTVRKLEADLKRFQDQDDEDVRQERARNGWWAYLASPVYGKVNETEEQKQARETARLHRLASKSIKGSELDREKAKLQRLQNALQDVNGKIAAEKKEEEDEKRKLEDEARARRQKMEQEERIRMMRELRERAVKAQKERDEQAAKEDRKAQAAREAQEAQELVRMAAAAERRRKQAEERAEAMRVTEEAARKARKTWDKWAVHSPTSTCRHDRFWPKVEGRQLCSNCYAVQRRFAFQCPGCQMVACANCRQSLRGQKRDKGGSFGRRYDFASDNDYIHDYSFYDYD